MPNFGDLVRCYIPGHGTPSSMHYVVGSMKYGSDVLLVADKDAIGMPINAAHCTVISSGHKGEARLLRQRYEDRWPNQLAPLDHWLERGPRNERTNHRIRA